MFVLVLTGPAFGVEDGLIAPWTFDEGCGATARDACGNGNAGTVVGALFFGGQQPHVSAPDADSSLDMGTPGIGSAPSSNHEGWSVGISRNGTVGAHLRHGSA